MPGDVVKKIEITAALSQDYQAAFAAAGNIAKNAGAELNALSKREADLQRLASLAAQRAAADALGNQKAVSSLSAQYDRLAARLDLTGKSAEDVAGELSKISARRGPLMELRKTAAARAELGRLAKQIDDVSRAYAKLKDPALGKHLDTLKKRFRELGGDVGKAAKASSSFSEQCARMPGPVGRVASAFGSLKMMMSGPAGIVALLVGVGAAVVAATKALFNLGIETAKAGDQLLKTADALGISTDAYQELSYAMQRGGASESEFSAGLKSLQSQMAAAASGNARAVKAFRSLGISISEVKSLNAEEMFARISDGLAAMDDPALRVRTGIQLLGGSGEKLASALSNGSEALDGLRARARQSGFVRTRKELEDAAAATDAFLDAQLSAKSALQEIGFAVMPAVASMLRDFAKFVSENREGIRAAAEAAGRYMSMLASGVSKIVGGIRSMMDFTLRASASTSQFFGTVKKAFTETPDFIKRFRESVFNAFSSLGQSLKSLFDRVVLYIKSIPARVKSSLADLPVVGGMFGDSPAPGSVPGLLSGVTQGIVPRAAPAQVTITNNIDARGGDSETGAGVKRALATASPVVANVVGKALNNYGLLAAGG